MVGVGVGVRVAVAVGGGVVIMYAYVEVLNQAAASYERRRKEVLKKPETMVERVMYVMEATDSNMTTREIAEALDVLGPSVLPVIKRLVKAGIVLRCDPVVIKSRAVSIWRLKK